MRLTAFALALIGVTFVLPAQAAPQFTNGLTLAGDLLDLSGGSTVNNGRVGFFSDLYYDPNRMEWWGLSDRGPGGGTMNYDTRVHRFSLSVNPTTGSISTFKIEETIPFRFGSSPLNGLAPNPSNVLGLSFDPEGFVIVPRTGNFLVSDEYGPSLYEFGRDGALVRQFAMPPNLLPKISSNLDYTAAPKPGPLTSGREPNRGLEGLAISPDGKFAYAMLQNGTVTDGNSSGSSFARSLYSRILKFDLGSGGVVGQYAYRLDGTGTAPAQGRGISALVALDDHRFLVLERNNRGVGVDSTLSPPQKLVYRIDLLGASDVSLVDLNVANPTGVIPVTKQPTALINLADPTTPADSPLAALGGLAPEKWEGLTIGPQLIDGSFLLLVGTDNGYSVSQNGTSTQLDVYYNSTMRLRAQCTLGTQVNCVAINADGSLGSPLGALPSGHALIPGVLQAYKVTTSDLDGYSTPVPGPAPLLGAAAAFTRARQRRQRLHP